jgi:hypothetical protein
MNSIWKFPLGIKDDIEILIPESAKLLHLEKQKGMICLWALVNPKNKTELRTFKFFGTGHSIYNVEKLEYVGTIMLFEGSQVYHLFEVADDQ